jgi:hypothetical protein
VTESVVTKTGEIKKVERLHPMYAEIEEMERILATFLSTKSAGAADHRALIQQQIDGGKMLCPSELEY